MNPFHEYVVHNAGRPSEPLAAEVERRMRAKSYHPPGSPPTYKRIIDEDDAVAVAVEMIERERKSLIGMISCEEVDGVSPHPNCGRERPDPPDRMLSRCYSCQLAMMRERAEAAEKREMATLFIAAANDLHIAAKHQGTFEKCVKHKCVHLRETARAGEEKT